MKPAFPAPLRSERVFQPGAVALGRGAGGLVPARCRIPASLPPSLSALALREERNRAGQESLAAPQQREGEGFSERAAADVSGAKSTQVRWATRLEEPRGQEPPAGQEFAAPLQLWV